MSLLQPARNRAAQDHVDARDELARAERLCDVVIATDLQPEHAVDFVVAGGEEEDRNIGRFADFPADVEAVEFRHADIEHDEIGPIAGEAGQRLLAVARLEHGHAGFFERDADDLADMKVIVDDKDTVRQSLLRKIAALNQAIAVSLEPSMYRCSRQFRKLHARHEAMSCRSLSTRQLRCETRLVSTPRS